MKKEHPPILILCFCLGLLAFLGGCVASQPVSSGGFYVETLPSSRVYLLNVNVRQGTNELIISGDVSRRNAAFSGMGHVDVAVVSPDGTVACQGTAPYTPKILPKTPGARKHRPSHFELAMSCNAPSGSTVRVAYHNKPAPDEPSEDLHENYAVPQHHDYGG